MNTWVFCTVSFVTGYFAGRTLELGGDALLQQWLEILQAQLHSIKATSSKRRSSSSERLARQQAKDDSSSSSSSPHSTYTGISQPSVHREVEEEEELAGRDSVAGYKSNEEYKMVLVVREDLGMGKGKIAAQV